VQDGLKYAEAKLKRCRWSFCQLLVLFSAGPCSSRYRATWSFLRCGACSQSEWFFSWEVPHATWRFFRTSFQCWHSLSFL